MEKQRHALHYGADGLLYMAQRPENIPDVGAANWQDSSRF